MPERSHTLSDDELLVALAASFPVEERAPDTASLQHLARAVATLRPTNRATNRPHWWDFPRRISPAVIAGAVVGMVGAGTGISYAVGDPLPTAVHSIARSVGLASPATPPTTPVTTPPAVSPTVNAARQAEATLGHALAESHPAPGVISRDSSALARRLAAFGGRSVPGASGTTVDGQHLLDQACRQLGGSGSWSIAYGSGTSSAANGATDPTGVRCTSSGAAGGSGIGTHATGPGSTAVTVPSTIPGSGLTSPFAHSGTGTGGQPDQAPIGGTSHTPTGFDHTTPGSTSTGFPGSHGAHDTSRGWSSNGPGGSDSISHTGNPAG